ncbi:MAG TPA: hypothetical protein VI588_01900 [Candidatus Gracilibacteria bacterium]|nr:hypothetical protein [Candidatus Gracilibacteria bacterium]
MGLERTGRREEINLAFPDQEAQLKLSIVEGNLTLWHKMPADQRDRLFAYIKRQELLDPRRAQLLNWMLHNRQFDILEEQTINIIIMEVRENLLARILREEVDRKKREQVKNGSRLMLRPKGELMKIQRKPDHPLDPDEMKERFSEVGVDVKALVEKWTPFYMAKGYREKLGDQYKVEVPRITESAMRAFEIGFENGTIDTVMLDDARIGDGETMRQLQPSIAKQLTYALNASRSLSAPQLRKLMENSVWTRRNQTTPGARIDPDIIAMLEMDIINEGFFRHPAGSKQVRLVGIKLHTSSIAHSPAAELSDVIESLKQPYTTLISIGTYARLVHFLRSEDYQLLDEFEDNMRKKGDYTDGTEIFLNNFLTDGPVTAGLYRPHRKVSLVTTKEYPSFHSTFGEISFLPVIQSDLTPPTNRVIIDVPVETSEDQDIPF